ncbi:hypothetical protein [Hymenobacter negativus]|uniref:Glycosyltransferase RgtA/B/C/D-like domain-containing protein n=1 Tax=Hymenobacter negativus TaxID=2795026 RepID=A0ABS3QPD0_9BACT|nr:hypothetical protein [Hymenobacter negativus]MBO2013144.1 hypothetical protein [Hymenobacter negativus]
MPPTTPANNAQPTAHRTWWLLAAVLLVGVERLWRLPEAGPPDYDSVRNWQVIQELVHGNFAHLFHHGSPGFLLLYLPVALFTRNFLVFQTFNALLGVAGVGAFAAWVARQARLSGLEAAGLVLLGGTSLLLTFSGRDFTMSSGSLVLFAGLLRSHYTRLQQPTTTAIVLVAMWLALGLCFSYKFLFAVPILVVLEVWQADRLWRKTWYRVLLVLAAPYVLLGVAGVLAGLPWYRWLGFYVRTVVPEAANAAGRQATLHLDLLYYVRYLLCFESPLLLGLAGALWLVWRERQQLRARPIAVLTYLLVWAGCLLAGMSLLIKAPRGLLFAYLPLAALAVLSGRRLLPQGVLAVVLLAALSWNGVQNYQQLYDPLPTRYPQVAAWLRQHDATNIASTVGIGLAPYLAPSQQLTIITDERQLAALRRQGCQYVLLDGYWRAAGVAHFDSLRQQVPVAAWPAPQLQQPLLFLEHSEFTGLGFDETLDASTAAAADSLPLRLYRLR